MSDIFGKIFDNLDPSPRDRLEEMRRMYGGTRVQNPYAGLPNLHVTDGDRLEATKAAARRAQIGREEKKFLCAGCTVMLTTAGNATHCECPRCHTNNELYDVTNFGFPQNTVETKARVAANQSKPKSQPQQGGKTTDNDDIIDIAYEEV